VQFVAEFVREKRIRWIGDGDFRLHGGAGRGIVNNRLQDADELLGFEITLALDDFLAVFVKHHGGGPAVILVAIGKIGARILIDFDGEIFLLNELADLGVAVGGGVHDMAPMAPNGLQVE